MLDLITHAKAGEFKPVAPRDFVQIDAEPHFKGFVMSAKAGKLVVASVAGLFLADMAEVSIVRRAGQ